MTSATTAAGDQLAVEMRGVTVRFGSAIANDAVDLSVGRGEIHALLGENGAGKTTLMRVLAGLLQPSQGTVAINGRVVSIGSPLDAASLGIGMVHQHFMLIPAMTIAENVALGLPGVRRWFPRLDRLSQEIEDLGRQIGFEVDAGAPAGDLSVAGQQRVEILKQLIRGARILVLDEPTAVLTPQEADRLFAMLKSLAARGTSIIFISHKLREVMSLTHRMTVLRRGRVAATLDTATTTQAAIARLMVGSDIELPQLQSVPATAAPPILEVDGITVADERGLTRVAGASFSVRSGEILGVAGVDGNGQQELAEAIVGLRPVAAGSLRFAGSDITRTSVAGRRLLGIAHIPEDRHRTAIFDSMSIADNIIVNDLSAPDVSRTGVLRPNGIRDLGRRIVADYDVRCTGVDQPVGLLSGGNQQKVVLGRELRNEPRLVVAVQPTRGLDIGATGFLQRRLLERRAAGAGVFLVSMELEELQALSDRIIVMFKGAVMAVLNRGEITPERLGLLMAGEAA